MKFHVLVPDNVHQKAIDILAVKRTTFVSLRRASWSAPICYRPSPMPTR